MLPYNAFEIREKRAAIVLDYDNKGIQLWRNSLPKDFLPCWYLESILTISQFDSMFPEDTLAENLNDALLWFNHDCQERTQQP